MNMGIFSFISEISIQPYNILIYYETLFETTIHSLIELFYKKYVAINFETTPNFFYNSMKA